jgi:hypothetical protein
LEAERAAAFAGRELAPETPNRVYLPQARTKFLEKKRLIDNDRETVTQYEKLTTEFLAVVKKKFADELEEVDLLRFCDALRKRGCEERTVKNYYSAFTATSTMRDCSRSRFSSCFDRMVRCDDTTMPVDP